MNLGKQSIQCKKEKQLITGRCGGQIRGEQADNLKVGTGETLPDIRQSKISQCCIMCRWMN